MGKVVLFAELPVGETTNAHPSQQVLNQNACKMVFHAHLGNVKIRVDIQISIKPEKRNPVSLRSRGTVFMLFAGLLARQGRRRIPMVFSLLHVRVIRF